MSRQAYKKNISPAKSIKRKKLKHNGQQKKVAVESVVQRFKKAFGQKKR